MVSRTWQDNAAEFAALDRGEGWPFARLVASSVMEGQRGGDTSILRSQDGKTSADRFAREAGVDPTRIRRYFKAWQEAAKRGWVPDAATLSPSDAHEVPDPEQPWRAKDGGVYDASKTGGQISNVGQIADKASRDPNYARTVISEVAKTNPEVTRDFIREQIVSGADPGLAGTADQALDDHYKQLKASHPAPSVREPAHSERLAGAVISARAAQRNLKQFAERVAGGEFDDTERGAINGLIDTLRNALDLIHAGVNSGTWDDELADLLRAQP